MLSDQTPARLVHKFSMGLKGAIHRPNAIVPEGRQVLPEPALRFLSAVRRCAAPSCMKLNN